MPKRKKTKEETSSQDSVGPSTPKRVTVTESEAVDIPGAPLTPSRVSQALTGINFEAVLANISPIKNKRFVGELVDSQKAIGLVGFDSAIQSRLDGFKDNSTPILLKNCDVRVNSWTKQLEVVVKQYTEVVPSQREFQIENIDNIGANSISLSQLSDMPEFSKVNVRIKVIDIKEPQTTGKSLVKQEVTIADSSGNCVLTLWEKDIDSLQLEESYYITKLTVRLFNGDRTLSMLRTGCKVEKIEDIGEVNEYTVDSLAASVEGAVIIGVKELISLMPF